MKVLKLLLVLPMVLVLAGWSGKTPEETFRTIEDHVCRTGNILTTRPYLANPEVLDELERLLAYVHQMDPAAMDQMQAEAREECARVRVVEFLEVDIRGDEATIRYLMSDGEEGEDELVRRDGKWKLVLVL